MIPSTRPKLSDLYTLSQSKLPENHTLTAVHTYVAHIWQYPPPPPRDYVVLTSHNNGGTAVDGYSPALFWVLLVSC